MGKIFFYVFVCLITAVSQPVFAVETSSAYQLLYDEQEPGTEIYRNRYLITDNYLRIDELEEDSGYILFDNSKNTIYSVSHDEQSILVIKAQPYKTPDMKDKVSIEYRLLNQAPKISDKPVYNYRVVSIKDKGDTCIDVQLAEGLLPDVTRMLKAYQAVVASQQVILLKNTPEEYQTSCFLYDQVYNDGRYYEKGLPIQEWHSNDRKKLLSSYKVIDVESKLFTVPENYRQYSLK